MRVKAYNYTKSKLPKCLYSVQEYDLLAKTKRGKSVKNVGGSTSSVEKPHKRVRQQPSVDKHYDGSSNEDDLPLAVAFQKKKKKKE